MNRLIYSFLILSALANVWFCGGFPEESLSERAYRQRNDGWGWFYRFVNALFFFQDDHCKNVAISAALRRPV